MRAAAGFAAAAIVIWASWGYLRAVVRRRADPRLASWAIWAASMSIAAAGAALAGQWPGAALATAGSATAVVILAAGWRHGDREFGRLDAAGLVTGGAGVILLAAGLPGWEAVAVSVAADLAAFAPTYLNGWSGEEPPGPWVKIAAAAALALAATDVSVPAGVIFPAYELAACAVMAAVAREGLIRRGAKGSAAHC